MINGFFIIDKPPGRTSHDVVNRARRILGTRKIGHTGTLDPFATGVLPIAVNEGTKAIPFLDEGIKQYDALLRLGIVTDTYDLTGRVLFQKDYQYIDEELLKAILARFTGMINQTPPMFSAIKKNGRPLYELARQGIEIERQPRCVEMRFLEIARFDPPFLRLLVTCSRGAYIRSLANDIGSALGCGSALQELRRIASGPFKLLNAITLDMLEERCSTGALDDICHDLNDVLSHLPVLPLTEIGYRKVMHGRSPAREDMKLDGLSIVASPQSFVRLSSNGNLVAIAQVEATLNGNNRLVLKRVFSK